MHNDTPHRAAQQSHTAFIGKGASFSLPHLQQQRSNYIVAALVLHRSRHRFMVSPTPLKEEALQAAVRTTGIIVCSYSGSLAAISHAQQPLPSITCYLQHACQEHLAAASIGRTNDAHSSKHWAPFSHLVSSAARCTLQSEEISVGSSQTRERQCSRSSAASNLRPSL